MVTCSPCQPEGRRCFAVGNCRLPMRSGVFPPAERRRGCFEHFETTKKNENKNCHIRFMFPCLCFLWVRVMYSFISIVSPEVR